MQKEEEAQKYTPASSCCPKLASMKNSADFLTILSLLKVVQWLKTHQEAVIMLLMLITSRIQVFI